MNRFRCHRCLIVLAFTMLAQGFGPGTAVAREYLVQFWGVDEGLSQSSVTDMKQTRDGYLWIGTLLGGLSRFDGLRFENFDPGNTPSLKHPGVRRLLTDSEGVLWINDYGGNLLRRTEHDFVLEIQQDVQLGSLVLDRPDERVFAALDGELIRGRRGPDGGWKWERQKAPYRDVGPHYASDPSGALWYRRPNGRLGRYAGGRFEDFATPPGLKGRQVNSLSQGPQEEIWVGTEIELARWNGHRFQPIAPTNGEVVLDVKQIVPVAADRAWVEANGRFRLVAGQGWELEAAGWDSLKPPWSRVRILRHDNEGGVWISFRDEGLAHVQANGSIHRITAAEGLPSQVVQAFQPDLEGNLWTGYHRGGLVRVRQALFRSVARPEGLADTVVTSVTEDAEERIWIGTTGGFVARWEKGAVTNLALPQRGTFCQDTVVCAGPDGRVWVGTGGNGLLVHEAGAFRHVLTPAELTRGVRILLCTRAGDVWFANFDGLFRLRGGVEPPERIHAPREIAEVAGALAEGPQGEVWMGTLGGELWRRTGAEWDKFRPTDDPPASRFWSLLAEADGSVWIGTLDQGLLHFREGRFARFKKTDGLPDEGISQILSDGRDLWLASRSGLLRISREALRLRAAGERDAVVARVFGRDSGLLTTAMALEFGPNCVRARDGRLWFSSAKGVAWTVPTEVGHRELAPPVAIESVQVDGRVAFPWRAAAGEKVDPGPLRIGPGLSNLEIHYTAPKLSSPELVQFRYRLANVNPEWTEAGARRTVSFSRLPPGNYVFQVIACNRDGIWSQDGASLGFVIQPYLWERRSFQAACVLVIGGLGVLWVRTVTKRRMQRRLDALERQQALARERARIAQDLHDDLGAGLTEISLTSDLARRPDLDPATALHFAGEIGGKARELVATMDEIVWAVNPRNDSVASLAAYFCQYAQHLLKPANIRCRLAVDDTLPASPLDSEQRHQLFLAFKEALNNAVRHSSATEVRLAVRVEQNRLCISLEDDGKGIQESAPAEGTDGLRNMRERLARIGGACEVASGGGGTAVHFRVPLAGGEN